MLRRLFIAGYSLLVAFACAAPGVCAEPAASSLAPNRQPNVHIDISKELLNAVMASSSRTSGPFSENIDGSVYRGMSTTNAKFSIRTEPSDDAAALILVWQATVNSNSRSSQQRTDVSSVSTTHIGAIKKVSLQEDGWHVQPARSKARSHSRITGVSSRRIIGRRTATRRAYEQRSGVDYSVARHAESRTRNEFDRQMGVMLASWQKDFNTRLRAPLTERNQLPQLVQESSTKDGISLAMLQASADQYGAVTGLSQQPGATPVNDFSLSLHQSAINNLAAGLLAGEKLREDQLAQQLEKTLGWKLVGLRPSDPKKLWSIDFDKESPLQVEFSDGTVTMTLQAQGFAVGQRLIPGARLRVTYQLSTADGQLSGTRQGRIEIEPLTAKESENVGVRFQVFRSMLRQRFDRLFPPEFTLDTLPTPATWPQRATLHFATMKAQDEWLQLDGTLQKPQAKKLVSRAN